jgi:hypothetical protein
LSDITQKLSDALVRDVAELAEQAHREIRIEHDGRIFSTKEFKELVPKVTPSRAILLSSLEGLVAYGAQETGFRTADEKRLVMIESPTSVELCGPLFGWPHAQRISYAVARGRDLFEEAFGAVSSTNGNPEYLPIEQFLIALRSRFVATDDLERVVDVLGNASWEEGVHQADDGFSQKVATRAGAVLPTVAVLPKYLRLRPYRTFTEVDQPEAAYVLRVQGDTRTGVRATLIEADAGAWRNAAMASIKAWFKAKGIDAIG